MNDFGKKSLLVIDDDHGFLDLIGEIFKLYDFDVKCVDEPVDAVNQMKRGMYSVVLLDYGLPIMNGDQLIANLQTVNPNARFIILSGMGGDEIEDKFRGLGYYAFFEKGSLQVDLLRATILEAFKS